ncbi:MAG TPA: hypothetical protein DC047_20700 [Blastocatellia bacterium]|nr:hypothetical protein [Blastocatellia bacterium]
MLKSRRRAIAIVLGIVYPLILTVVVTKLLAPESLLFLPLLATGYLLIGIILGFRWRTDAWVLGLCLMAFWIIVLIGSVILTDTVGSNIKVFFQGFAWQLSVIVATFAGIALGRILNGRRLTEYD